MEVQFLFAGLLLGLSIAVLVRRPYFVGTLRVDTSDPEDEPYLFLELEKGVGDISSKRYVLLKVNLDSYLPHS